MRRALAFENVHDLGTALSAISAQQLPVWSITFLNPESIRLKKQLPHRHGHPYEMEHEHIEPDIPELYVAMVAYPESRRGAIHDALNAIVESANALPSRNSATTSSPDRSRS